MVPPSSAIIIPLLLAIPAADAFSSSSYGGDGGGIGGGFGAPISLDRFRATCPADLDAVLRFDPTLLDVGSSGKTMATAGDDDVWVAVYRSANNLPSVFVRDAFFDAMRVSTSVVVGGGGGGAMRDDSEMLVSSSSSFSVGVDGGAIMISNDNDDGETPVAVARLGRDVNPCNDDGGQSSHYIIDSMRCALRKEETDPDCDGGSEHAEAIGICIDELVLAYLRKHSEMEKKRRSRGNGDDDYVDVVRGAGVGCERRMSFDGGIHFRGTLVSGRLLDSRGFREVDELSADMHSHESDYDGALDKYSERSTSRDVAKYQGARDRALRIVSYLGRLDREEDKRRSRSRTLMRKKNKRIGDGDAAVGDDDEGESDFDPWASVKKFI
ncbi:hypothetical protein ACHAXA_011462 [Cyclostephanos tholiformis]|uniref:Uncharacterized protein n=1 Tax=Cyclostephanos tholiformis TaxID=382380 RepID=A0ABD3SEE1_9STRA